MPLLSTTQRLAPLWLSHAMERSFESHKKRSDSEPRSEQVIGLHMGASTAQRIIAKYTRNRSAQSFASKESQVQRQWRSQIAPLDRPSGPTWRYTHGDHRATRFKAHDIPLIVDGGRMLSLNRGYPQ